MQTLSPANRIKFVKWLDEYAGRWLIRCLTVGQSKTTISQESKPVRRILVIKLWGIGSLVLMEPALRLLRRRFPDAQVEFLTLRQNCELFTLMPHVDTVRVLEFDSLAALVWSSLKVLRQLRARRYDHIYDAEFFANFSAIFAWLAGPRCVIGFARANVSKCALLDLAVPFDNTRHAVDNFEQLVSVDQQKPHYLEPHRRIPKITAPDGIATFRSPYIVINVNASPLALERRWPAQRFARLANWLTQSFETRLLFIGSRAEQKYTQSIIDQMTPSPRVRNLAGQLDLQELSRVLAHSELVISNDSGPLHLAAALGKPVVAFYGPETPRLFGPLSDKKLVFYLALACSPCMSVDNAKTVNCTNNLQCLQQLEVELVIKRLQPFVLAYCPTLVATTRQPILAAWQGGEELNGLSKVRFVKGDNEPRQKQRRQPVEA